MDNRFSVAPAEDSAAASYLNLNAAIAHRSRSEATELLSAESDATIAGLLAEQNPSSADAILWAMPSQRRASVLEAAAPEYREQWLRNHAYPEGSIGRLMDPPLATIHPNQSVQEIVEWLRPIVKKALITYGWVVDDAGVLVGVLVFRELLFASPSQPISELMVRSPFSLRPELSITDAMREALKLHFPVYPVCDTGGKLVGIVRGQTLFEHQAFELSAQAGSMVGVEREERLGTPWQRSFKFRHPWLQLNLLTAFIAAAVVGAFQGTLDRMVILSVFLPVLAGQSGNTGCQALAVALRGITLGEMQTGRAAAVVGKEALLGFVNGLLVGLTAGLGMLLLARSQGNPSALQLALVVIVAMAGSCTVSGMAGAVVPMILRRIGADPATASSIFLTTATDVVSMGTFLGLATWLAL
ncbi:MAG TPA: magnesium transporter [Polyangiaceae bacterium]|nr:magnesium transporter [Polyangiaceae bacterium]